MKAYKMQIQFFHKKCNKAEAEAQQWKSKFGNLANKTSETSSKSEATQSDSTLLDYYDKLYKYDESVEISPESETIKLLNDVECKRISYTQAFKSSKPIQVVKKLMIGIYGYEDLVTRSQKGETYSEELRPLDKKKSEAVERELYRFLWLNNYNVQLIKIELRELVKYIHNAISCAKLKLKRKKKAEAALADLEAQRQNMEDILGS